MLDISNIEGDVTEKGDASIGCITRTHSSLIGVLISGGIRCALSLKICSEARTHVFQNTHKSFWEIRPRDNFIKITNYF